MPGPITTIAELDAELTTAIAAGAQTREEFSTLLADIKGRLDSAVTPDEIRASAPYQQVLDLLTQLPSSP